MATQTDEQLVEEGPRNAVVRLTGVLTESDVNLVSVIPLSLFQNNEPRMSALVGLRVNGLDYAVSDSLKAVLYWNGASPQLIAALSQSDELGYEDVGGLLPDQLRTGYDGSINLRTYGFTPGSVQTYTVTLRLVKLYRV